MSALPRIGRRARSRGAEDTADTAQLYLELLKRALTHTLYWPIDVDEMPEQIRRPLAEAALAAVEAPNAPPEARSELTDFEGAREEGRDWPQFAQTMVGMKRLDNVHGCVEDVLSRGVPGDLIEAGVWRGGVVILMRGILKAHGVTDRIVFGADSFEGLPEPSPGEFPADEGALAHEAEQIGVSAKEVRANLRRYGLLDDQVRLVKGWFSESLPRLRGRTWAVIRLDGDYYESTRDALENLYPGLSVGGYAIIDDYGLEPCRKAVDDYRAEHGVTEPVERIDWVGAYWQRER